VARFVHRQLAERLDPDAERPDRADTTEARSPAASRAMPAAAELIRSTSAARP
jgi:hypothetical protein